MFVELQKRTQPETSPAPNGYKIYALYRLFFTQVSIRGFHRNILVFTHHLKVGDTQANGIDLAATLRTSTAMRWCFSRCRARQTETPELPATAPGAGTGVHSIAHGLLATVKGLALPKGYDSLVTS